MSRFYLKYDILKYGYNMIVWCVMLRRVCLKCARGLRDQAESSYQKQTDV
jgi:hypothetical protein